MDTGREYDDLVARLTREHYITVHTDDGPKYIKVAGLIQQLRDEIFGSLGIGDGSGGKHRLPLNAPATDLYQLIDRQVSEVWSKAYQKIPGVTRTEGLLALWSAKVDPTDLVRYSKPETIMVPNPATGDPRDPREKVIWVLSETSALNLLRRWARAIEELFNPPRTAEIKAACIQCGVREVWRPVDGQVVKQTALVFVRDRETGESTQARCLACEAVWLPAQFRYLAEKIAANERHADEELRITSV